MREYETKVEDLKTFDSGAKRDTTEGKGSYDLISPIALKRLALVYERGAKQKGSRNWEKGIPFSRCIQSSIRHIYQYIEGLRDEDHLMQAAWNLFAVAHFEEIIDRGLLSKELNDLPNYLDEGFKESIEKADKELSNEKQISEVEEARKESEIEKEEKFKLSEENKEIIEKIKRNSF